MIALPILIAARSFITTGPNSMKFIYYSFAAAFCTKKADRCVVMLRLRAVRVKFTSSNQLTGIKATTNMVYWLSYVELS